MKEAPIRYCVNMMGTRLYWHGDGFALGVKWFRWAECVRIANHYREFANVACEVLTDDEYFERLANDDRMKRIKARMGGKEDA